MVSDWRPGPCGCGSGESREPAHDARGIFLTFVCDVCRAERLRGFRPEVLEDPNYEADEDIEGDSDDFAFDGDDGPGIAWAGGYSW